MTIVALLFALSCTTTTAAGGTNRTVEIDGKTVAAEDVAKGLVDDAGVAKTNHHDVDAKALYTRVTVEFSDTTSYGPATLALAHMMLDAGDAKGAQAILEKLLLQDPTTPVADDARYVLAMAQLQQGDSKSAAPTLKSIVDKMPEGERGEALQKLGHQLVVQGNGVEAVHYIQRAMGAGVPDRNALEKDLFTAVDGE
ncbi:MAG TPA: tetratricopeptide repeat protein, partial [Myxococcota bacterium]